MTADIATVMWKEWRTLLGGRSRRQLAMTAGMLLLFGAYLPWSAGSEWAGDVWIFAVAGAVVAASILVPDAIAGERERHTLATLLASRLPDRAILFGKLGFALMISVALTVVLMAVSLVVANIKAGELFFYSPDVLFTDLGFTIALAAFTCTLGVFISLRSRTVQEAQQLLGVLMLVPPMLVTLVGTAIGAAGGPPPAIRDLLASLDLTTMLLVIGAIVVLVDVALAIAAARTFRRDRLI